MRDDNWFVYILLLANKAFYTGITNDIPRRLKTHESKKGSKYVRSHLPLKLVYHKEMGSLSNAASRERAIKKLGRAQKSKLVEEFRKEQEMKFPIEPILDRIIIKKDSAEVEANAGDSGLVVHLPDTVKGRSRLGTVIAAGPGRINLETGGYVPLAVKAGDRVALKEFDGYRFDWDGEVYFVFTENEIIGKLI